MGLEITEKITDNRYDGSMTNNGDSLRERVEALAERCRWEADNAEHGARSAAEMNDGTRLHIWQNEQATWRQVGAALRAALEA